MIKKFIRNSVYALNIIAAVLLFLSLLAPYILPGRLAIIALLGLGLPILIIIQVLFLLYWILLKSKRIFLPLLLLALVMVRPLLIKSRMQKTETNHSHSGITLKALSYNIHIFGVYRWHTDMEPPLAIYDFIRENDPDIACFQEFYDDAKYFPSRDSLLKHQRFKDAYVHYSNNAFQGYSMATFSKYPIIKRQSIYFKNRENFFLQSDILVQQDTIRILNFHMQSTHLSKKDRELMENFSALPETASQEALKALATRLGFAFQKRAKQAQELSQYIQESPYPVLCMGDMNDTPNSYSYQKISTKLFDSYLRKGKWPGHTYSQLFIPFRIDYILYSPHFRCNSFQTHRINLSDHEPVSGSYTLYKP